MELFEWNKLNFLDSGFRNRNLGFKLVIYYLNYGDITVPVPRFMLIMSELIYTIKT